MVRSGGGAQRNVSRAARLGALHVGRNLWLAAGNNGAVKPKILLLVAHYLPGVKSGGPIRSISNLVEALGDEMDFRVVTTDRDQDEAEHYAGITPDRWTRVGKAEVLYLS